VTGRRPQQLSIEVEHVGTVAIVAANGEVDLATADEFANALDPDRHDGRGLVLDLRSVPFMDSSGLAVVVRVADRLRDRFAVVVAEGSPVERLFELTEVLGSLSAFRDTGAAPEAPAAGGAGA